MHIINIILCFLIKIKKSLTREQTSVRLRFIKDCGKEYKRLQHSFPTVSDHPSDRIIPEAGIHPVQIMPCAA